MMGALSEAAFQALAALVTEYTVHKDICKPSDAESVDLSSSGASHGFLALQSPGCMGRFCLIH